MGGGSCLFYFETLFLFKNCCLHFDIVITNIQKQESNSKNRIAAHLIKEKQIECSTGKNIEN